MTQQQQLVADDNDGRRDFDFIMGRWKVHHRRLRTRLKGDTQWDEFTGTSELWPLMNGLGNVDDDFFDAPTGSYRAATIRSFDPVEKIWSIWWLDGRFPQAIDVPMRGRFENGLGTFLCDDMFEGRPIKVRFFWRTTQPMPRWEQAFSEDGGETWETNWVMDFERAA